MKKIILLLLILILSFSVEENYYEHIQKNKLMDEIRTLKLGTITIPKISKTLDIVEGTNLEILNQNVVGHVKESSLSFDEIIILAGHNSKKVFGDLKNLKKGDQVILKLYDEEKIYTVFYNIKIKENDYSYFQKEKNTLVLITCTETEHERRLIILKTV